MANCPRLLGSSSKIATVHSLRCLHAIYSQDLSKIISQWKHSVIIYFRWDWYIWYHICSNSKATKEHFGGSLPAQSSAQMLVATRRVGDWDQLNGKPEIVCFNLLFSKNKVQRLLKLKIHTESSIPGVETGSN